MSDGKHNLAEFVFNNIEEVKDNFIKNKICIDSEVMITQDSDGTISAWPSELGCELWFEEGMWFASTGENSALAKTVMKHETIFNNHNSEFACVYAGIGCIDYDDDVVTASVNLRRLIH